MVRLAGCLSSAASAPLTGECGGASGSKPSPKRPTLSGRSCPTGKETATTKPAGAPPFADVPFNVVAVADGREVGQVSGSEVDHEGSVELTSMWVAPDARGRGVGEALIAAVIDWAQESEARQGLLAVKSDNRPATALYERTHFVDIDPNADNAGEQVMIRRFGRQMSGTA